MTYEYKEMQATTKHAVDATLEAKDTIPSLEENAWYKRMKHSTEANKPITI